LKVAICEDNPSYLDYIDATVKEILEEGAVKGEIVIACKSQAEMEDFLLAGCADVYLLDINLNSGFEGYYLALKIREAQPGAYIVFISENISFVLQSFKARPFDFLPKPVSKNLLLNLFMDIQRHISSLSPPDSESEYISIRSLSIVYRIKKDEIIMIEKHKNKAFVYTAKAKITCNTNLEDFESYLFDMKTFVRCHKSYIVNKKYIIEKNSTEMTLKLEGGLTSYVSRNYRKLVF
jgi:DNA-binding LytR/AlgR family response regulator